jgi:hypothetical protein
MRKNLLNRWLVPSLTAAGLLTAAGCFNPPMSFSEFIQGPAPRRMPSPAVEGDPHAEDVFKGGQVFSMYCSYCHNAPALSERNFANFRNVATHMRVRANLTGEEYRQLMVFIRRWHDVPPPHPPTEPSPKRFIFSQPIAEEKERTAPLQPPGNPGLIPREVPNEVRNTPAPPPDAPTPIRPVEGNGNP